MFLIFRRINTNKSITNLATLINFKSPLVKQAVEINMLAVFVFFHTEANKTAVDQLVKFPPEIVKAMRAITKLN